MGKSVLLIVVDKPEQRLLFNKHLKTTPHSLIFATDGEDGFDRYTEVKPDLVIAHVNAARLDGTILCQLIRQQPGGGDVPFVLIGEEFIDPIIGNHRKKQVAADAFLPVPFTKTMLVQCITPLLAFGRPAEEENAVGPLWADADPPTAPIPDIPEATPAPRGEDSDLDTVVSFKNPFYRPEVEGPITGDFVSIGATLAAGQEITDLHGEGEPLESARKIMDPAERVHKAIQSSEEIPTGPDHVDPTNIDPSNTDPSNTDPLAEPKIDTGVRRLDRPTKSDLIQEPVREKTPSASNEKRLSQVRAGAPGGTRRGLDESQLGKRLAKRVRGMYKMLGHVDYYRLLGLEPNATLARITDAYFEHSLEFHPDRFFLLRSGDLKEKIYEIYRHVGQAYRVLSDDRARLQYDAERASGKISQPPPEIIRPIETRRENGLEIPTQTPEAERFVGLASAAIDDGDLNGARLHLHLALTYERGNAALKSAIADVARQQKKGSP